FIEILSKFRRTHRLRGGRRQLIEMMMEKHVNFLHHRARLFPIDPSNAIPLRANKLSDFHEEILVNPFDVALAALNLVQIFIDELLNLWRSQNDALRQIKRPSSRETTNQ